MRVGHPDIIHFEVTLACLILLVEHPKHHLRFFMRKYHVIHQVKNRLVELKFGLELLIG